MNKEEMLKKLKASVSESADKARMNAGYSGSWGDGGAHDMEKKLEAFLDGYEFALTGKTKVYAKFFEELDKEQDPEYQKYLELKGKFDK